MSRRSAERRVRYNHGQERYMARLPLTEEQVGEDCVVLDVEKVGLTDEQFVELCLDNRDFNFELTAQKELVIMSPPGPGPGGRNTVISYYLVGAAKKDGRVLGLCGC